MSKQKSNTGLFILIFICGLIVGVVGTVLVMNKFSDLKVVGTEESVTIIETENGESKKDETENVTSDEQTAIDESEVAVLKVNDAEIMMQEVNIYMYQLRDFYTAQYGEAPWEEIVAEPDVTVREYAKEELKKGLIRAEVLISKADEYNVTLTDEERQTCAEEAADYIKSIGPVICQDFGLTEEADRLVKEKQYLSTKVYNAALDALAATMDNPSDAELAEAFEAMYEEWLKEYTVTEYPVWENIVMGSVG